jgi:DNA-binding transcriptional regulator YiaG
LTNHAPDRHAQGLRRLAIRQALDLLQDDNLPALRRQLAMSQTEFARLLAVSLRRVQDWERGVSPPPPMARRRLEMIQQRHAAKSRRRKSA